MEETYFILLAQKVAVKIERGLTPRPLNRQSQESDHPVLAGSLWRIPYDEAEISRKTATFYSAEFDDVVLPNFPVHSSEIQKLSKEHFDLLHAVPTCQDRYEVFRNAKWMAEAVHLKVGSIVYLVNMPGFLEPRIAGRVRYKGALPNEKGTWFGIELSAEFRGKGTCDGNFRRKRFFTCHMSSAVFKPISRMEYCPFPEEFHEGEEFYVPAMNIPQSSLPPPPPLSIGDRVVWISDIQAEKGVVKWIGMLPDVRELIEWMVGVEFENPVGTGTGKYKDKQLFKAKQGHASLVPVLGLMKESEFYGPVVTNILPPSTPVQHHEQVLLPPSRGQGTHEQHQVAPEAHSTAIPHEETGHREEKYAPTIDSGVTSPITMGKPFTAETEIMSGANPVAGTVPMRNAQQYYSHKQVQSNTGVVTNRAESNLDLESPVEANATPQIENHYDRFNEHCDATRFSTMHHSQPSQMVNKPQFDKRLVSTTDRPVHQKYQQSDRYQRATGPGMFTEFTSLPPERPEKQITDKEGMSIYDTHPYENVDRGTACPDSSEDIYEPTNFVGRKPLDDWSRVPRSGELNGHLKYSSSVDVRSTEPSNIGHGRFGVGSVDGLDTRIYSKPVPLNIITDTDNRHIASPGDNYPSESFDRAAQRRANYQHSNTDPQPQFSHSDDFGVGGDGCNPGHHTAPGGTPDENFSYLNHPANSTVPLPPKQHVHVVEQPTLDYKNISKPKKSPKAKSVDDILKRTDFEPMPRYFGNSIFYQSVARNDENLEEDYRHLLSQEALSNTSPSTEPYTTGPSTASNSRSSTVKSTSRNQRSSSADDLDSGLSYNTMSTDHQASTIPSDYRYGSNKDTGTTYKKEGYSLGSAKPISRVHEKKKPVEMTSAMANTELGIGSTVEVTGNPESFRYGVIRWLGHMGDKNKPLVGLEMEIENASCSDGTFGDFRLFKCAPRKAFFVFLSKVKKDGRFQESPDFAERKSSQAFGSLECPDITGEVLPPMCGRKLSEYMSKDRGIQGHHNSCYMDATLFSMFAFSTVFDDLLRPQPGSNATKDKVQLVLREGIVNPLRENFYVRADKIMKLRVLLDEHSKVKGLTDAEKDPEEFLNSLLQDTLKAEAFIKLSSGLQSYLYQMILERDDQISLPTTQQLLGLSFLQSNLKLAECPRRLILQMPRCGKKYKMYQRIVPSLTLDVTDILEQVPRECTICSNLATYECTDCFKHFGDGSLLDISFCDDCLAKIHSHTRRSSHSPTPLTIPPALIERYTKSNNASAPEIPRVTMELFAVICIETSHYVAVVRAGDEPDSPWLFFDSMADRMGEQHGYNVPEVKLCRELPDWLKEENRDWMKIRKDDRDLPEHLKRVICDGYICMYESRDQGPANMQR